MLRPMAANPERRAALADAGLRVLARMGPRGLTHRAVDEEAEVPRGTTSNYFRSRDALLGALGERIFERLGPPAEVLARPRALPPSRRSLRHYVHEIVRRTTSAPEITTALFELRLEATRNPALAERLGATLARGFEADVRFHASARLPGGALEIALLHYAIDGLLLDRLGPSIGSGESLERAVDLLVDRLVPAKRAPRRRPEPPRPPKPRREAGAAGGGKAKTSRSRRSRT